jgi:hypothetical protein
MMGVRRRLAATIAVVAMTGAIQGWSTLAQGQRNGASQLVKPFDPNVFNLGPNFQGKNCPSTYATLKRLKLGKDEFETTAAYEKRLEAARGSVKLGPESLGDLLAFRRIP